MSSNAGWTDKAEKERVDAVQTQNIPIIDGSRAFAKLHHTFANNAEERGALDSESRFPALPLRSAPAYVEPNDATRRAFQAAPTHPAVLDDRVPANVAVGESLVVLRHVYPEEACYELGGIGWRVRVLTKRKGLLRVDFLDARSANNNKFVPEWLPPSALRRVHSPVIGMRLRRASPRAKHSSRHPPSRGGCKRGRGRLRTPRQSPP
eukprot:6209583-Pleurochrysis_carterae.AAC.1